ncbi:MAG: 50S ribosomal protein L5 [Candidatus Muirbacterium halophilum]|nr:50S ribosomal protein L5 [Candidatus Muirbacterium halophilum]MCK9475245.1 50S ribosomal protein L5 [Candidatus Muirbacterium halophilum]
MAEKTTPRLLEKYKTEVIANLKKEFGINNPNRIPKIQKVTVNMGIGEAKANAKALESALDSLTKIAGQKPVVNKARKSISNFKIRAGYPVGVSVTLRGERMYHFLDRLFNIVMPRIKDFRGVNPKQTDGRGNFNMGLREQIIFPEIKFESVDQIRGMDIAITTSATTDEECIALLRDLGMPFRK